MVSSSTLIFRLDIHGRHNREVMFQFLSNCGDVLVMIQLPNYRGDMVVAMGNSKGMVIKVEYRDNRRNKVSTKRNIKGGIKYEINII